MSALIPFWTLNENCDVAKGWVSKKLTDAGFRVVTTFNLQVARSAHAECTCPHHGTEEYNCQLVVLLIYGKHLDPATLVLHGQDGKTWISLTTPVEAGSGRNLDGFVRQVLAHDNSDVFRLGDANAGLASLACHPIVPEGE